MPCSPTASRQTRPGRKQERPAQHLTAEDQVERVVTVGDLMQWGLLDEPLPVDVSAGCLAHVGQLHACRQCRSAVAPCAPGVSRKGRGCRRGKGRRAAARKGEAPWICFPAFNTASITPHVPAPPSNQFVALG